MPSRLRPLLWPMVVVVIAVCGYAVIQHKRGELVDFAVPFTAATRVLAHEQLYRPEDGHYQYKYLPAFAFFMVPFTWLPKKIAEALWYAMTIGMTWAFFRLSLRALPDRRMGVSLVWLTLLFSGKYLVKELVFGQFNLPLGLLLVGAVIAAQHRRDGTAGALTGVGIFVKPYALVLVPWLAWTHGWRSIVGCGLVVAAGLALPATMYGWSGNLALLHDWYRTVSDTTAPNLMAAENISFASMWAKRMAPGALATRLATLSSAAVFCAGALLIMKRRTVRAPDYLECAYFFVLIPLLSPQGWDYVLLLALPAYMCLTDRWKELTIPWRLVTAVGIALTSFVVFDLMRRPAYLFLMHWSASSVGAVLLAASLVRLRWQALA